MTARAAAAADSHRPDHEVLIIGAGLGGIGAGVALRRAGIEDFVIVDRWSRVGGTWLANTYPGVAVDIPSFIYSFSFAQRSNWSRLFAPGAELQEYAEDVVDQFELRPHLKLQTEIVQVRFDEDAQLWRASLAAGAELTARFMIGAVGGLEQPKLPDIDGIESFAGKLIHTARWDHDYDLAGKRVVVIGTGATALQLIPEIAEQVQHLTVFQRTPIWVAPKIDWRAGPLTRSVLANPLARRPLRVVGNLAVSAGLGGALMLGERAQIALHGTETALKLWMRTQVTDPELRDKLTPRYMLGCKRPSMSNTYLRTFTRPDVTLVTDPIERISATAIHTSDGRTTDVDVLICATGFKVMERGATPPYPVFGRGCRELGTFWHENRFQAYHGVSVPAFPNAFLITGPYGYAPSSYTELIEATAAHAARAIAETRRRGAAVCEIRQEAHDRYHARILERAEKLPFRRPSCAGSNTYYVNYQGDAAALRPSTLAEMWWQNRHFPLDDYEYRGQSQRRLSTMR